MEKFNPFKKHKEELAQKRKQEESKKVPSIVPFPSTIISAKTVSNKQEDIMPTVSSAPSIDITIGDDTIQNLLLQQENPLELQEKLKALFSADIKTEDPFPINARDLHGFLGIGKKFADWIKDSTDKYSFMENQDFEIRFPKSGSGSLGGQNKIDYYFTVDAAKELAMVQKSDLGKLVRRYLIWAEKKLREVTTVISQQQTVQPLTVPQTMGQALTLAGQAIEALEREQAKQQKQLDQVTKDLVTLKKRVESQSNTSVLTEEIAYNPITADGNTTVREFSDILKGLGYDMGIIKLNHYLVENDMLQRFNKKGYKAKKKFVDLGWFVNKTEEVELPNGDSIEQYKVDITPTGRQGLFLRLTRG